MANRPVFIVKLSEDLFLQQNFEFDYFSGFSITQKRKCINSLHKSFLNKNPDKKVLEISSKSESDLGNQLSAFNLIIKTKSGMTFSVESAFQASKVFEKGGPYQDLLLVPSIAAKKDKRLTSSGKVVSFRYAKRDFSSNPKTFFYNWLYVNTLNLYPDLVEKITEYDAFTDIVFNPQKSINCQAEAAAIFVSLYRQNLLKDALKDSDSFLKIVYQTEKKCDGTKNIQMNFFK